MRLISTFVEREAERQRMLLEVARELAARSVESVPSTVHDVTSIFESSESKVIQSALKRGGKVLAGALPGFAGSLKGKLGPELAAHARIAGVAGIFHSDELPAYGIGEGEVDRVRRALGLKDLDAFVLVAEDERKARLAFEEMRPRATAAIRGVPPETREPRPDGSTVYSRPLPGKARMYPETDVPPIRVTKEHLERIREGLPERPEVTVSRLVNEYGIHGQQARQLVQEGTNDSFELIAREFGEAKLVATVLLYTFPELRREGLPVDAIPLDNLRELFSLLKAGHFAKEAIPDLLRDMARHGARASEAAERLGVRGLTREAVGAIVDEVLATSGDVLASRGEGAEKALMGRVMERVRGRADGKLVSDVLHARLEAALKRGAQGGKKGKKKKAPQRD